MSRTLKARLIFLIIIGIFVCLYFISGSGYTFWKIIYYVGGLLIVGGAIISIIYKSTVLSGKNKKAEQQLDEFVHQEEENLRSHGYSLKINKQEIDEYTAPSYKIDAEKNEKKIIIQHTYEKKFSLFLALSERRNLHSETRTRMCRLLPETSISTELHQNFTRKITANLISFTDALVGNHKRSIKIGNHLFDADYITIGEHSSSEQNQQNELIARTFLTPDLINALQHLPLKRLTIVGKRLTVTLKGFQIMSDEIERVINILQKMSKITIKDLPSTADLDPEEKRVIAILKNHWLSLGNPKIFDEQYYDSQKIGHFLEQLEEIQNLEGVKLNTGLDENSLRIKKKSQNHDIKSYIITADVQYYFESTNGRPLEEHFQSTSEFEPAEFKLICKDEHGKTALTKVENSIF